MRHVIRDGFTWAIAAIVGSYYLLALSLLVGLVASMIG